MSNNTKWKTVSHSWEKQTVMSKTLSACGVRQLGANGGKSIWAGDLSVRQTGLFGELCLPGSSFFYFRFPWPRNDCARSLDLPLRCVMFGSQCAFFIEYWLTVFSLAEMQQNHVIINFVFTKISRRAFVAISISNGHPVCGVLWVKNPHCRTHFFLDHPVKVPQLAVCVNTI